MRLLLDTHIWIWSYGEPHKLAHKVAAELRNPDNEIWLSPVSVWELTLLTREGRLNLEGSVSEWVQAALTRKSMNEAPLTTEVALAILDIQLPQRDPADLFLAATAKVFDLTLVTADTHLLGVPRLSTLANR